MDGWMNEWMDGWMTGWTSGWVDGEGWMMPTSVCDVHTLRGCAAAACSQPGLRSDAILSSHLQGDVEQRLLRQQCEGSRLERRSTAEEEEKEQEEEEQEEEEQSRAMGGQVTCSSSPGFHTVTVTTMLTRVLLRVT